MSDLLFYDAAVPPPTPPKTDGVGFYIGGDALNIWTKAQIDAQPARYRLPIYVRSHPGSAVAPLDVAECIAALRNIGAPKGCLVAWDTETAADASYMATVYGLITAAGWKLIDYGSQDSLFANQLPAGGYYWGAEWTGTEHIDQGDAGTQYANDGAWDLSIFKPGLPFWDTRNTIDWQEAMMQQLPTIRQGMTGNAVRTVQGLCAARDFPIAVDGIFGSATALAVKAIQHEAKITADSIVGPRTWPVLLGI